MTLNIKAFFTVLIFACYNLSLAKDTEKNINESLISIHPINYVDFVSRTAGSPSALKNKMDASDIWAFKKKEYIINTSKRLKHRVFYTAKPLDNNIKEYSIDDPKTPNLELYPNLFLVIPLKGPGYKTRLSAKDILEPSLISEPIQSSQLKNNGVENNSSFKYFELKILQYPSSNNSNAALCAVYYLKTNKNNISDSVFNTIKNKVNDDLGKWVENEYLIRRGFIYNGENGYSFEMQNVLTEFAMHTDKISRDRERYLEDAKKIDYSDEKALEKYKKKINFFGQKDKKNADQLSKKQQDLIKKYNLKQ